jgi:phenylacetate-CoA ligase
MGIRSAFYDSYSSLRGHRLARYRHEYEMEARSDRGDAIRRRRLRVLLDYGRREVPYYRDLAVDSQHDVFEELKRYPILSKDIIRSKGELVRSRDFANRHWYFNTSGGSTGEPIQLIQDREYADRLSALTTLLRARMGYRFGQLLYQLWGSEQEVLHGLGPKARFWSLVNNSRILNAFRLSPDTMREYLHIIDLRPPRLLVCYAQAAYELARYALAHEIKVAAPHAITCSAGTLYPFMREAIERVFRCPIYNWYGSREVGIIATQLPLEPLLWARREKFSSLAC